MKSISWKEKLNNMKPNERIGASLRWSDKEQTLQKRLNKFRKLGYLKYLGCIGVQAMYSRTDKVINETDFK